jgi:hypothetical protein
MKIRPVTAELFHADGQTDMTKLIHSDKHIVYHKNKVFWDVTPCELVNSYRRFEEFLCLHLQGLIHTKHEGTDTFRIVRQYLTYDTHHPEGLRVTLKIEAALFPQITVVTYQTITSRKTSLSIVTSTTTQHLSLYLHHSEKRFNFIHQINHYFPRDS